MTPAAPMAMKTIDVARLACVTGGRSVGARTLDALQSKFGGGGWITMNGAPKVTPGKNVDVIHGSFRTDPWAGGNPSVNRSFTGSVPHGRPLDPVQINGAHVLRH
jgi:hypothetical protein